MNSVLFASKTVIDEAKNLKRPNLVALKGTRDVHSVMPSGLKGLIVARLLSCFCKECIGERPEDCGNLQITKQWREHSVIASC